jgi:hypothetical protein
MKMRYVGPERRIHKVYVTRNTEYHLRRDVCVAVKSRTPVDGPVAGHDAVNMRLEGHLKQGMVPMPGPPKIGFRMYFARGNHDVFTSPVVDILRPSKSVVAQYPADR